MAKSTNTSQSKNKNLITKESLRKKLAAYNLAKGAKIEYWNTKAIEKLKNELQRIGPAANVGSIDFAAEQVGLTREDVIAAIYQMAADRDDGLAAWLVKCWKNYPDDFLADLTIDQMCKIANRAPSQVLNKLTLWMTKYRKNIASLRASMELTKVVAATVESALQIGPAGLEDRKILLKQQKFIEEQPKVPLVSIDQRTANILPPSGQFEQLLLGKGRPVANDSIEGEIVEE